MSAQIMSDERNLYITVNNTYHSEIQYDKERDWKLRTGLLFYKLFVLIDVQVVN